MALHSRAAFNDPAKALAVLHGLIEVRCPELQYLAPPLGFANHDLTKRPYLTLAFVSLGPVDLCAVQ